MANQDYQALQTLLDRRGEVRIPDGVYTIRSLYFDYRNYSAYEEKMSGVSDRAKYRIRYYNYDTREIKLEIRDKLDYINISERMIYPGLDGICKWITRRYSNLGPVYNRKEEE